MTPTLSVTVRLRSEVPGLPYRNPTKKRGNSGFVYWVQVALEDGHFTLFLEVDNDINVSGDRNFEATAYFLRDDLNLEEKARGLLQIGPMPLINGPARIGEMELSSVSR